MIMIMLWGPSDNYQSMSLDFKKYRLKLYLKKISKCSAELQWKINWAYWPDQIVVGQGQYDQY